MKVAIPTTENQIADHFGHCEYYTIAEIENDKILNIENIETPQVCGCKSGIVDELAGMGATVMLAGNMGHGASEKVTSAGIELIRGCEGTVEHVLNEYINGTLLDSEISCGHNHTHHDHGNCSH